MRNIDTYLHPGEQMRSPSMFLMLYNGDGKVTLADVAKLYQFLKNKITMEDFYIKAGDTVGNNQTIKVVDVSKLYQYIKGTVTSL